MTTTTARATRAKPMPVEERRASIARATLPLLVEHGRDVTTRQIAEAAGVAEGTLFRVFDDKEAIIDAAVEEFLDPEPFRAALRRIDPSLPLELKIELILDRLLDRFAGIFGVFAALGGRPRPPQSAEPDIIIGIFEDLLAPDLQALRAPPGDVFRFVRLVAFASAMPHFGPTTGLDADRLANLIVHGIAGEASERPIASIRPGEPDASASERGAAPCS
ncbi:TetR/AcrR family transcriptional regulator [Agromyces sp. Soil535]|uniref:TetR/AcrR family transcriptional regulator n=1 Tax=Agromyces sp. Soil535 TaxID=1736390 RepID=UPI00190FE835|nr:TetR/AcrR family transcriptional regulator [Agromyces sp. Soil535]